MLPRILRQHARQARSLCTSQCPPASKTVPPQAGRRSSESLVTLGMHMATFPYIISDFFCPPLPSSGHPLFPKSFPIFSAHAEVQPQIPLRRPAEIPCAVKSRCVYSGPRGLMASDAHYQMQRLVQAEVRAGVECVVGPLAERHTRNTSCCIIGTTSCTQASTHGCLPP